MPCWPRVQRKSWPRFMARDKPAAPGAVLVTRPAGQAGELCRSLRERGWQVLHQPMLELEVLEELPPQQRQILLDLDSYQHVIFVSANAVRHGMDRIGDFWPQLPVGLNWYTVGAASAELLEEYGINVRTPATDMSSEGLLALPALQTVSGQRILIVRGEGGRTLLREELGGRGAQVDELACYRRKCPQLAAGELAAKLSKFDIQLILISSGEGLVNLQTLLSPLETTKFTDTRLVVPSQRVAELARDSGFKRVIVAQNASDRAMLCALEQWVSSHGE